MLFKFLNKFLKDKFQPAIPIYTVPKLKFYASVPFLHNNVFTTNLTKLIKQHFPALDLKLIPKNPMKLGNLFNHKDKLPLLMQSKVVYEFTCPKCKIGTYLGATK